MRYQYRYYFHNAQQAYDWSETMEYIIEMCNITKEFPGIIANAGKHHSGCGGCEKRIADDGRGEEKGRRFE